MNANDRERREKKNTYIDEKKLKKTKEKKKHDN
jgi:hypothetical protein